MSGPKSSAGSLNLAIIVILLGLVGLLLEPLVFLAFVVAVGYVVYRLGRRLEDLEARIPDQRNPSDKNGG
jgi:hypothetical protein